MPRFFVDEIAQTVVIGGADARHIAKALRMKAGEEITLCDQNQTVANGVIVSVSPQAVTVRTGEAAACSSEPTLKLSIFAAWPKGDKAELIVQKCVELGVVEVVFVLTERCVSRPTAQDAEKKIARLQKIAAEAAGQCGRAIIPKVDGILPLSAALERMAAQKSFVLYEGECAPLRTLLPQSPQRLAFFSGCEGGFSPEEIRKCTEAGVLPASLGQRILRCETAPIAAAAAMMFYCGEMD